VSSSRSGVSEGSNAASLASEELDAARIKRLHRAEDACLQEQQAVKLMSSNETIRYPVDFNLVTSRRLYGINGFTALPC
jgi:hypothetical protein